MKLDKRVNVLILRSIYHIGGAESVLYETISNINKGEYNIVLCSLYHPGPMGNVFIDDGYKFYHRVMKSKYDLRAFYKLKKIVLDNNIDLIYLLNEPLTLFWGFVMGKICKIPIISVIHNTVVMRESIKLYVFRILLPHIDKVVAVANMQKKHLVEKEKLPGDNVSVIHNGVDVEKFNLQIDKGKKIQSLGLDKSKKIVGIIARLFYLKGIDIFLRAAKVILEKDDRIQFIIVGDGPEMSKLTRQAIDLGIKKDVHFLGSRNDISEILAIIDVAVLSSRTEALPMVVLECMASAKSIVATNVGSIPELITDGETGFLVDPENPQALADKITILLNDQNLAQKMGKRAKIIVNERFRLDQTVKKTKDLFDELVPR
jgi:glycosyltransferase involved in cell wall biosynthesis